MSKVCVIDEDRATYACVASAFGQVEWFRSAESFLAQLASLDQPAVVVANVRLPGMDGVALVTHLRDLGHAAPVILVCEDADIATAVRAIRSGADECLEKGTLGCMLIRNIRDLLELEIHDNA